MLFLKKEDIIKSFSMREAIDADKKALSLYSAGKASVPLRTNIDVPKSNGQSLYMPAYVEGGEGALGVKIVSVYPENLKKNLPSVPATMIVLDPETGMVSACLDGTYLTQLRTGAVQGAATELLAREDAKIGALIGTGGQAQSQLEAMLTVRKLEEVRIFDIDFDRASRFAEEMMQQFSVTMRPTKTSQECVEGADIIITSVTTSKRATFSAEWVKKGAHINGVGAYTPEMCEIPREIIKAADVVIFDTMDGVLKEAGDFISPLQDGYIQRDSYHGELGQLINEELIGRTSGEQITIFKTVGSAVLDVVVATEIVNKAKENNLGKLIY
ncbi:TPA: ornithine cyclodeaminase family protein [Enterococcus faecium]|nr:ornithine cyclodeaminase family protein [Enterococcus faecium]